MQETDAGKLGETLRRRRLELGLEVKQIAHRADLAASYVSRIERGTRGERLPKETIEKLARGYDFSVEEIEHIARGGMLPSTPPFSPDELLARYQMTKPVAIPVVEHPAHAGHAGSPVIDYVYVERTLATNKDLICVPVVGDCMAPTIASGDRVIVERGTWPEQGEIVLAVVEERVIVRRFYRTDSEIVMRADNTEYPDVQATEADIVGVVLEIRKRARARPT